jgi:nitronate monooxygenase
VRCRATQARDAIAATRALHRGPLNVNVFVHRPARADAAKERAWLARLAPEFQRFSAQPPNALREIYTSFLVDDAMLAMLVDARPEVVSFHFGLPTDSAARCVACGRHRADRLGDQPGRSAAIEAAGLDAIVAQGYEAGGIAACSIPMRTTIASARWR